MAHDDRFALVRYDVDRIERELAGIRGRFDGLNARITEIQRIITNELSILKGAHAQSQSTANETLRMVREVSDVSRETLEQVRVAQEQQGRMLREIEELKSKSVGG